jgi:hypothetical protein
MGTYFAICDANHGVIRGWKGPERESEEEADKDAAAHKKDTYDHEVDVEYKP